MARYRRIFQLLLAIGLAGSVAIQPSTAEAQGIPDLDRAGCSNGSFLAFLTNPADEPALIADCQTLVSIRNHWTRHPGNASLPADHPLQTWGSGDTVTIDSWEGITVGVYPHEDRNLPWRVKEISLYNRSISGTLPKEIGNLTALTSIWLDRNSLSGPIPQEIGNLINLTFLGLAHNELSGTIPSAIGNLTEIEILWLGNNNLTGAIPNEIGNLSYITDLQLYHNQITGRIPGSISQLSRLVDLRLFPNNFSSAEFALPRQLQGRYERSFDSDELRLIAKADAIRNLTLDKTEWEVWICDVGGPLRLNVEDVTRSLNNKITPYFDWLSEGKYIPTFLAKDTVQSPNKDDCDEKIDGPARDKYNKQAVVVENSEHAGGFVVGLPGQPGVAVVGGGSVTAIAGNTPYTPRFSTVAHEMGHLLDWPHNFCGLDFWPSGAIFEGGNPMDIMSSSSDTMDLGSGTIAINRYASGWIDPDDVIVHQNGAATYRLSPVGVSGKQMLVIPSNDGTGVFYTLGARVKKGYDRGNPKEGVEVYLIDQRLTACGTGSSQADGVCWGTDRRVQPFPPTQVGHRTKFTYHVHGAGDIFRVGGFRIEVKERRGYRFSVVVGEGCGGHFSGRFCDEDDTTHERNIEQIAEWEITLGCGGDRFCPDRSITRIQMAAFLYRAYLRQAGTPPAPAPAALVDVPDEAWYRQFAEWAVSSGVMRAPAGMFHPNGVVTRADMAEMMVATFDNLSPSANPGESVFADMTGLKEDVIRAAEGLRAAGVTQGCSASPLRYCPDQPVTRAQMASFFVRAINT